MISFSSLYTLILIGVLTMSALMLFISIIPIESFLIFVRWLSISQLLVGLIRYSIVSELLLLLGHLLNCQVEIVF